MKLLLMKFVEQTTEMHVPGEKVPRDQAMTELWSLYERGWGVTKLHEFLKLSKSDLYTLDFSGFINQHKGNIMLQSYGYNLIDSILNTNKNYELSDIIGSDHRIRDGVMNAKLESLTAKLKQTEKKLDLKHSKVQVVNSPEEFA